VLGGDLGGGFSSITDASLITTLAGVNGTVRLPLRSPIINNVRSVSSSASSAVIGIPTSDNIIVADTANADMLLILPRIAPPNTDITGQQFTVKRIDANPNNTILNLRATDVPIDDLPPNNNLQINRLSGITVVADGPKWRVIGRL
jgi:hypothetical protein